MIFLNVLSKHFLCGKRHAEQNQIKFVNCFGGGVNVMEGKKSPKLLHCKQDQWQTRASCRNLGAQKSWGSDQSYRLPILITPLEKLPNLLLIII